MASVMKSSPTTPFAARVAAAAKGINRHHQAKVVIVKAQGQPVMAVLPADRQLNLRKLEQITHSVGSDLGSREMLREPMSNAGLH
jgi:prolyl-tRNA editing enzyme YbaK/EbsC (Cys-tRNA(Pro) deacylase)